MSKKVPKKCSSCVHREIQINLYLVLNFKLTSIFEDFFFDLFNSYLSEDSLIKCLAPIRQGAICIIKNYICLRLRWDSGRGGGSTRKFIKFEKE